MLTALVTACSARPSSAVNATDGQASREKAFWCSCIATAPSRQRHTCGTRRYHIEHGSVKGRILTGVWQRAGYIRRELQVPDQAPKSIHFIFSMCDCMNPVYLWM